LRSTLVVAVALAGCVLPHASRRDTPVEDTGVVAMDSESPEDSAVIADSGVTVDTGVTIDTGVLVDTGVIVDTGVTIDAGVIVDTGVPCGALGQACCEMGPPEKRCKDNLGCLSGACRACGEIGQPCCNGDCRTVGASCANSVSPPVCSRGVFSDCGGEGQVCCAPSATVSPCRTGLVCLFVCVRF
jgi:hypothetical protein